MRLNIFEPRYRLLVRRAMEGNRRFGMAMIARDGQLVETACEVEIVECQPVPDGRYMLEIEGKRRCRLQRSWEQDGYRVAQPEYFGDDPVEDGSPEADELLQATAAVAEKANALLERLRQACLSPAELLRWRQASTSFQAGCCSQAHRGRRPSQPHAQP